MQLVHLLLFLQSFVILLLDITYAHFTLKYKWARQLSQYSV